MCQTAAVSPCNRKPFQATSLSCPNDRALHSSLVALIHSSQSIEQCYRNMMKKNNVTWLILGSIILQRDNYILLICPQGIAMNEFLPGTHLLYTWVERDNCGKLPCLMAYAPSGIRTYDPLITSREYYTHSHTQCSHIILDSQSDLGLDVS